MNFFITENNNPFANFGIFSFSVSLFLNIVYDSCHNHKLILSTS
ncbi:hypothetical protein LTSEADE_5944 [Salmonella enterica subsp. enterica serovar Adelaide str. A4-669]|uniref:Uncharacterized protein n=1 Tax=Salmonella enterica subsp. enterica serovar Adelaide str. A4-669 TaxID=913063 RepID=A0A6C8GEU4_SALET|nr:hypothetical protein LTSEADE_5944 [Salmonella enterica subsp. enterica serovar Adelaide str. A4-669]